MRPYFIGYFEIQSYRWKSLSFYSLESCLLDYPWLDLIQVCSWEQMNSLKICIPHFLFLLIFLSCAQWALNSYSFWFQLHLLSHRLAIFLNHQELTKTKVCGILLSPDSSSGSWVIPVCWPHHSSANRIENARLWSRCVYHFGLCYCLVLSWSRNDHHPLSHFGTSKCLGFLRLAYQYGSLPRSWWFP